VSSPADIDALFRLPLPEFTAARNALATQLKSAGRAEDAARVKALPKPPLSAWLVNQLYWHHRKPFDQLMTAGQRLRTAQAAQLRGKPGELREPLEARRMALSELTKHAVALLKEAGHAPSPDLMRRITSTLEALATYGSHPAAPPAGRLTDDVDAPGFEALAALMPGKGGRGRGRERTRVLPFVPPRELKAAKEKLTPQERKRQEEAERRARLSAATSAVRDAERGLAEARRTAARAEASLKKAAARAKETKKKQEALSAQSEKASAAAEQARQEAHRIAAEAEEAAQAVTDAERGLDEARKRYAELTN
jgi:hypothetical protein